MRPRFRLGQESEVCLGNGKLGGMVARVTQLKSVSDVVPPDSLSLSLDVEGVASQPELSQTMREAHWKA
jgi:hypothetical protein